MGWNSLPRRKRVTRNERQGGGERERGREGEREKLKPYYLLRNIQSVQDGSVVGVESWGRRDGGNFSGAVTRKFVTSPLVCPKHIPHRLPIPKVHYTVISKRMLRHSWAGHY